jgi:branched-chain amino acid transport system substrate-binding protein
VAPVTPPTAIAPSPRSITIGVAGPITGSLARFGQQFRTGAEGAIADINAAGGVLGMKLQVQFGDDTCDPKQAREVAQSFVRMKVPLVIGHFCSSSSIPASEAYLDGDILQITPASTNPLFTERGLWNTFRVCGRDDQQGAVAAAYIAKNFRGKGIAIVHDNTSDGKNLVDETRNALNLGGVKERFYESYQSGAKDFTGLISKLRLSSIDIVYVGGNYTDAGLILRQMRDQGLKTVLMSGDALADMRFASMPGPVGEGVLFTFGPDPRQKPTAATVVQRFKAYGIDPEGYTLYAYAAVQVWAQAVVRAGVTDPKKVAATLKAGAWDTVLGKISYTSKGDMTLSDYVVYRWEKSGNYSRL